MKASNAHRLLPFETFGEAAAFDLEVEAPEPKKPRPRKP